MMGNAQYPTLRFAPIVDRRLRELILQRVPTRTPQPRRAKVTTSLLSRPRLLYASIDERSQLPRNALCGVEIYHDFVSHGRSSLRSVNGSLTISFMPCIGGKLVASWAPTIASV